VSGMKRRFSTRQVGRGKPVYEVVVRGFDPRGYLVRESTVISSTTGSDGPATRAEAQRHADWLNYAEECFYAGLPVPPHVASTTKVVEGNYSEAKLNLAVAMVLAKHEAADEGVDH
jgi:hypothetical protein